MILIIFTPTHAQTLAKRGHACCIFLRASSKSFLKLAQGVGYQTSVMGSQLSFVNYQLVPTSIPPLIPSPIPHPLPAARSKREIKLWTL